MLGKKRRTNKFEGFPRAKREAVAFAFGLIQSPSCPVPAPWENLAGDQADSGIANSGGQIAHEKSCVMS